MSEKKRITLSSLKRSDSAKMICREGFGKYRRQGTSYRRQVKKWVTVIRLSQVVHQGGGPHGRVFK